MDEGMAVKTKVPEVVQLKRQVSLFSATNFIIGTMIGSGIFVTPGTALGYVGSVGMALVVWALCGLICLLGALAYAELGTVIPRSGSEYAYFMESFRPLHKFWGPLAAFIYCFTIVLVVRPVEVAVIVMISSEYITKLIGEFVCLDDPDKWNNVMTLVSVSEVCLITFINATSVKLYLKVQNLFTFLKVVLCLIIIGFGIYQMSIGNLDNIKMGFEGSNFSPQNIALAFFSGLWAYDGWNCVTNITEEVKKPEVNILRSILLSIPTMTAVYVFMNVSYMTVLSNVEMTSSTAVAMDFGDKLLGNFAIIIPLGVSLSAFGCAMAVQFGVTRMCYVSGQEGHLPLVLSFIHIRRLTPAIAVMLQGAVSIIFIALGDVADLIEFASFLLWIGYGGAMVSVLVLRRTKKDAPRPFRVPLPIPILIILVSLFLFIVPLVLDPSYKYFIALGLIVLGFFVYTICIYKSLQPSKCMAWCTDFLQKLFEVAPSESEIVTVKTSDMNGDKGVIEKY